MPLTQELLMGPADQTLTPDDIAEGYQRCYTAVHGRTPRVQHVSGYWYRVNGEIVHRSTLTTEIIRLKQLERDQTTRKTHVERNVITRLIARLRAI
ncbi:MAG: hypothetical protein AAFV33_22025 [Chloroflexota bacterium]